MSNQILNEADKVIGNLMLEINRLNNEILLKDKKIEELKAEKLINDESYLSQMKEIQQLKALAISLSHRNANIQYTKANENEL